MTKRINERTSTMINIPEMLRLQAQGFNDIRIGEHFGVTAQAVRMARLRYRAKVKASPEFEVADTASPEFNDPALIISEDHLDLVAQLRTMNNTINVEIRRCVRMLNASAREMAKDIPKDLSPSELKEALGERHKAYTELRETQNVLIKLAGEVRGQLTLQLKVAEVWHDVRATAEFQDEVLKAIEAESPGTRDKILKRLRERKTLRGAVQL